MSYREFLEWIEAQLKMKMGKEVRIDIISVTKNNAIVLDGLSILEQGDNVSPAIYLNGYYQDYLAGEKIEHILSEIIGCYQRQKKIGHVDISFYTDVEKVKTRVVCRLVNREKNKRLLKEIPYRPFLDLAIVYYYLLDRDDLQDAVILVRNNHMEMWGMKEEELYALAVKNTNHMLPYEFVSMKEMMRMLMEGECWLMKSDEPPLYVLSNIKHSYGAIWITDKTVQKAIGERLQDDYYILPSSIHECMIVPYAAEINPIMMSEMVWEINQTQVEPEEVLGENIYFYNRDSGILSIVNVEEE